jgi:hypothetical protein
MTYVWLCAERIQAISRIEDTEDGSKGEVMEVKK